AYIRDSSAIAVLGASGLTFNLDSGDLHVQGGASGGKQANITAGGLTGIATLNGGSANSVCLCAGTGPLTINNAVNVDISAGAFSTFPTLHTLVGGTATATINGQVLVLSGTTLAI